MSDNRPYPTEPRRFHANEIREGAGCEDAETLRRWLRRAVTVASPAELLASGT